MREALCTEAAVLVAAQKHRAEAGDAGRTAEARSHTCERWGGGGICQFIPFIEMA